MAFTLRHSSPLTQPKPFQGDIQPTTLTPPTPVKNPGKKNFSNIPTVGTKKVKVESKPAPNRVIKNDVNSLMAKLGPNDEFMGTIATKEASTYRSGGNFLNRVANRLSGEGTTVVKNTGGTVISGTKSQSSKPRSSEETDMLKGQLIDVLKKGHGAKVINGQVEEGPEIYKEVKSNPQKDSITKYNKELKDYNTYKQDSTRYEIKKKLAEKVAEKVATRAAAEAARTAARTQPRTPAQQSRTPFYQKGIAGDKSSLTNNNKRMSVDSPMYQLNPLSNEKKIGENTSVETGTFFGRKGTKTTTTANFETPGNNGNSSDKKMSNAEWSNFVKQHPERSNGSGRSDKKEEYAFEPLTPITPRKPEQIITGNKIVTHEMPPRPSTPKSEKIDMETGGTEVKNRRGANLNLLNTFSGTNSSGSGRVCGCNH